MRVRKFLLIDLQIANFVSEPVRKLQIRKFSTTRQRELNIFLKSCLPLQQNYLKVMQMFVWQNFLFDKNLNQNIVGFFFYQQKNKEFEDLQSFKTALNLGQQIANLKIAKNIGSEICKSANCHTCRRSANVTNFVSPQICGFPEAWGKMIREKNLKAKNLVTLSLLSKTSVHTRIK